MIVAYFLAFVLAQAPSSPVIVRPSPCVGVAGAASANVWERAKEPGLRRFCDVLASGMAKLAGGGALIGDLLAIADDADKRMPGRAEPYVLRGRALVQAGRADEALSALREAAARDERVMDDPSTLLAWSRANARTHHVDEAVRAYRAVLPRTTALPIQERAAASFEAGMLMMSLGPKELETASAMLRQARRDAQDALYVASVVATALAEDRAGERDEARASLLSRSTGIGNFAGDPRVVRALEDAGVPEEGDALVALALEASDPASARRAWRRYLDGPAGKRAWTSHARAHESQAPSEVAAKRRGAAAR
ncbi:MAG: hypothetical protein FWD69_15855 [Polyangiaceae bacterium]|nr:hypothetical protein [Polyangiaceae bacterium]